jgi:hypothetical protein
VRSASDPKQVLKRRGFKTLLKRALTPCRLLLEPRQPAREGCRSFAASCSCGPVSPRVRPMERRGGQFTVNLITLYVAGLLFLGLVVWIVLAAFGKADPPLS